MQRYTVVRRFVPYHVTEPLLPRMWLEVVSRGVAADEVRDWSRSTWFPWLRTSPEVDAVLTRIRGLIPDGWDAGWAEPQLLMRLPDWPNDTWTMTPHVDELPPWAPPGSRYSHVVGVALTAATGRSGCLHVYPEEGVPVPVPLNVGDVVVMDGDLPHSGGLNLGADVRAVVYFRRITTA